MTTDREVDEAVIITECHDVAEITTKSDVDAGLDNVESIAKYSDLEGRMAEFEEQLRRDSHGLSPLPRETTVFAKARNWRKVRKFAPLALRFFPPGGSGASRNRHNVMVHWHLWRRNSAPAAAGRKKAKVKRQKAKVLWRRPSPLCSNCRHRAGLLRMLKAARRRWGNPTDIREFY